MDYSSPFQTIKQSHYQSNSQFQEEFWKIKAQRLEVQNEELSRENKLLVKQIVESNKREEEMRERLQYLQEGWKARSRNLQERSVENNQILTKSPVKSENKPESLQEIEKLTKQIRVLKNLHELQISKLNDQNKKLNKRLEQSQLSQQQSSKSKENLTKQKLNLEILPIKKKLESCEQLVNQLKQEKRKMVDDYEQLNKELQIMKMREKINEKEEENRLMDYRKYEQSRKEFHVYEQFKEEPKVQNQQKELPVKGNQYSIPNEIVQIQRQRQKDLQLQISKLQKGILSMQKKQKDLSKKWQLHLQDLQNDKFKFEIRQRQLLGQLENSKADLKNVLTKLSPLAVKEPANIENTQVKASLSLLQIFLKKYKIQAF